jgi:hypothetical protein
MRKKRLPPPRAVHQLPVRMVQIPGAIGADCEPRFAVDSIVQPPSALQQRAWECAWDLSQERSGFLDNDELREALQRIVDRRASETLGWRECQGLFRAHRCYRPVRT